MEDEDIKGMIILMDFVDRKPNRHFTVSVRTNNTNTKYRVAVWEKKEAEPQGALGEGFSPFSIYQAATMAINNWVTGTDIKLRLGNHWKRHWYQPVYKTWKEQK